VIVVGCYGPPDHASVNACKLVDQVTVVVDLPKLAWPIIRVRGKALGP
jgi:hypothetical protein